MFTDLEHLLPSEKRQNYTICWLEPLLSNQPHAVSQLLSAPGTAQNLGVSRRRGLRLELRRGTKEASRFVMVITGKM